MAQSRLESAIDTIVTQLKGITQAQGYRNTVKNVVRGIRPADLITDFPEVGIEIRRSIVSPLDKTGLRQVYDEIAQVMIAGSVSAGTDATNSPEDMELLYDASESMIHDLKKKICTDILKSYLTNATNAFNVELSSNELSFERYVIYGMPQTVAVVVAEFKIRIRALDASFDD